MKSAEGKQVGAKIRDGICKLIRDKKKQIAEHSRNYT